MSLLRPILTQALRAPQKIAAIDDQRTYTYGQLLGGALFLADLIDQKSDKPHVGILLPTGGAFPIALLGAWLARRVAVPLNYLLSPVELAYVIQDSEIDLIITAGPLLNFLNLRPVIPANVRLIKMEEQDFSGFPPLRWPPCYGEADPAVILYTSGTSGRPKGVVLSHDNLESNTWAGIQKANITHADTFLGVLPQFHSFGLTALTLIPLAVGSKTVYTARFVPKRIVQLIREHRPDIIMAVPSMYGALLSVKDAGPEDFTSVRFAISGGEPLPAATFEAYNERFGLRLLEGYGLTETSPVTHWSTPELFRRKSVGTPIPGVETLIVDDEDRPVKPGVDGEILIRGRNVMQGYFKLPDQTAAVFVDINLPGRGPVRFFRTGDIGHVDEEGFLYITGRKKEMLIIAGENVFPREIEEVLNRHPDVKDSAVIGKQDELRGEVPIAFIELNDDRPFDEQALRSWCREHLAQFKVPREIHVVEQLPRSPTGKILRRYLKETETSASPTR